MRQLNFFLLFLLFIFLLLSCRKTLSISGTVINQYTGVPIKNAVVQIRSIGNGGLFFNSRNENSGSTLVSVLTDDAGHYAMEFSGVEKGSGKNPLLISVSKESVYKANGVEYQETYFDRSPNEIGGMFHTIDQKSQQHDFKLLPVAQVKFLLDVGATSPEYFNGDTLSVTVFNSIFSRPVLTYPGSFSNNTSMYLSMPSEGKMFLEIYSVRDKKLTRYVDTIQAEMFTKSVHLIKWEAK